MGQTVFQTQTEELSALLSDVFSIGALTAPRSTRIFKGALSYLYMLSDTPTFENLFGVLADFISLPQA